MFTDLFDSSAGSDNAFGIKSKKIKTKQIPKHTNAEIELFFEKRSKNNCKPSIVPGY